MPLLYISIAIAVVLFVTFIFTLCLSTQTRDHEYTNDEQTYHDPV